MMGSTMRGRRQLRKWLASGSLAAVALLRGSALTWAGSLGAPSLATFLGTFQGGVVGLGVLLFAIGGAGWLNQKMDMVHMPALAGTMSWIIPGGLYGGVLTIASGIGLSAAGGTLPL